MTTLPTQEPARIRDSESDVATFGNHEFISKEEIAGGQLGTPNRDRKFVGFDSKHDAELLRKIDIRLIPVFTLVDLMSFLDGGTIGNTRLARAEMELHLVENQYMWTLIAFFFSDMRLLKFLQICC